MKIKDKIKKLRNDYNLSQQQLADDLNVSRSVVAKWESGLLEPKKEYIDLIKMKYNVDISIDEFKNNSINLSFAFNMITNFIIFLIILFVLSILFFKEYDIFISFVSTIPIYSLLIIPELMKYLNNTNTLYSLFIHSNFFNIFKYSIQI